METKKCSKCLEVKPIEKFRKSGFKNGKQKIRSNCRECRENRNYQEEHLSRSYGITCSDKLKMIGDQGGACAICGTMNHGNIQQPSMSGWHVDHDHETNKIRGILCRNCNLGLGYFFDSIPFLRNSIAYLEKFQ